MIRNIAMTRRKIGIVITQFVSKPINRLSIRLPAWEIDKKINSLSMPKRKGEKFQGHTRSDYIRVAGISVQLYAVRS